MRPVADVQLFLPQKKALAHPAAWVEIGKALESLGVCRVLEADEITLMMCQCLLELAATRSQGMGHVCVWGGGGGGGGVCVGVSGERGGRALRSLLSGRTGTHAWVLLVRGEW